MRIMSDTLRHQEECVIDFEALADMEVKQGHMDEVEALDAITCLKVWIYSCRTLKLDSEAWFR